jgi:fucose 4-O-acetylase-like acetyltransferase
MSAEAEAENPRLALIEAVKGFGIVLVVAAHLVKYGTPGVPDWYTAFKFKVYLFHMPLLMFMSGYVFRLASHHERGLDDPSRYAARRADRLLLPFFFLGVLTIVGKWLAARWIEIDEPPQSLTSGLISIFVGTESSPVLTIWYLFVLFVYCVSTPALHALAGRSWVVLWLVALAVHFIPVTDFVYANRVFQFYVFFIGGCLAAELAFIRRIPGHGLGLLALAGFGLVLMFPWNRDAGLLVCGLLACLALPSAIAMLPAGSRNVLARLGRVSMVIYLFNVIFIGVGKAIYRISVPADLRSFGLLLFVTFAAGLFGPILLKAGVDAVPVLRRSFGRYLS